jgi:hypothetical protein
MNIKVAALLSATAIAITVAVLVAVWHMTDPYRGYGGQQTETPVIQPIDDPCDIGFNCVPDPGVRPSVDSRIIEELEDIYGSENG